MDWDVRDAPEVRGASRIYDRLRSDEETLPGLFAVSEVARTAVFLDGGVGGLRFSRIIRLGGGSDLLGTVLRGLGEIHRVMRIELCPE